LSPTGGYLSVAGITDVCDERGGGQIMAVSKKSQAPGGCGIPVDGQHRDVTAVVEEFLKQRGMID